MPILISSINGDQSTYNVVDWIHHFNEEVHIINEDNFLTLEWIQISDDYTIHLGVEGKTFGISEIVSFWHRRGNIRIKLPRLGIPKEFPIKKQIHEHLDAEQRKVKEFLNQEFRKKRNLGNIFKTDINKLEVLQMARSLEISIPATLVSGSKAALTRFRLRHGEVICKPISEGLMAHDVDLGLVTYYTHVIKDEDIDALEDIFFTSLFQEKIQKKYELRIFYLDGDFYAMAIFSQEDEQTSVDFRKYNHVKPNRTVPFSLPEILKQKLRLLMKSLNLNTGSIDMAVTLDNRFVFFEINPVGQFKMTSNPCNFYLDKKIAQYLMKHESTDKT